MIFYFSGTGNSYLAAKQIAAFLEDELISIHHCLKESEKGHFLSERPSGMGIVPIVWPASAVVPQRRSSTNPLPKETGDIT